MIDLDKYQLAAIETARPVTSDWLSILLLGVQGEVGSLLAEHKKQMRDGVSYDGHEENFREELGDVLWYTANIAHYYNISLNAIRGESPRDSNSVIDKLFQISIATGALVHAAISSDPSMSAIKENLSRIMNLVFMVAIKSSINIEVLIADNLKKASSRWVGHPESPAKHFDSGNLAWEQLPRAGRFTIIQHRRGTDKPPSVVVRMNELNIGDRLTDNSYHDDGYRFHDVFHWAYAAVLGWSPVTRALFKAKRKSDPDPRKDENEDGARAQIIEEAISFQVYDYARKHNLLAGYDHVDHNLLKTISGLCRGLEVGQCAPWEWELAIIRGYEVFRCLRQLADSHPQFGAVIELNADKRLLRLEKQLAEAELPA